MKIAIIGISDKPNCKPLDDSTKTGEIVNMIISYFPNIQFYKTNLVNFAPLDSNGKLRYPTKEEIDNNMHNLLERIKDCDLILCLGNKAYKSFNNKMENIILIKHPSYIWIYKRKDLNSYIYDTVKEINKYIERKKLI